MNPALESHPAGDAAKEPDRRQIPIGWPRLALVLAAIAALSAAPAEAQLKKGKALKSKGKTCVECHEREVEDYRARESQHAALRDGDCESCHRPHGVVGILRLKAEDPDLCLSCHGAEVQGGSAERPAGAAKPMTFSHPPRERMRCSACHDPHGADAPKLLKEEGSPACLSCHEAAAFEGASRHDPTTTSCLTCHAPHGTDEPANLSVAAETVCDSCHDGTSGPERRGHGGVVPGGASCLSCHSPHASAGPGLLRAHVHPPLAEGPESCATCHLPGEDEDEGFPLSETAPELCLNCHEDPRQPAEAPASTVHAPAADGDCVLCHNPHASDQSALLKQPQVQLCGECHDQAEQALKAKAPHAPAVDECTLCHQPHAGGERLLRAPPPALCETCHEDVKLQLARRNAHPPAAEGECIICHEPHGSQHPGMLTEFSTALCAACHDDISEQVEARFSHKALVSGQCASCHEPHGSDADHLTVADLGQACVKCHESQVRALSGLRQHAPFAGGECLSCHRPHTSSRPNLLTSHPTQLCRSCHGDLDGEALAANRHEPYEQGQCLSCHGAHGGHSEALLRREDVRILCLTCHESEAQLARGRGLTIHRPFQSESCLTCHAPHSSPHEGLLAKAPNAVCGSCHNVRGPTLKMAHKGLLDSRTDCTSCHDGHASRNKNLMLPVQHAPFAEGECDMCHEGGAS